MLDLKLPNELMNLTALLLRNLLQKVIIIYKLILDKLRLLSIN